MNIEEWKKKPTKKELIDIIKSQEEVISKLHKVNTHFVTLLNSKENIIKEAREFIEKFNKVIRENKMLGEYANFMTIPKELLEILDKENI